MLIDEICDFLLPAAAAHSVTDVRVGLGYTAVQIDDGRCGLAYTFRDETQPGCCVIGEAGTLAGRGAPEIARWAKSTDPVASAVGLATLNALTDVPPGAATSDLLAELQVRATDIIGMVGNFGPLAGPLRSQCKTLHIFEQHPDVGSGLLGEEAAADILPECDAVILSATTLLNRTLDALLTYCRAARQIAILGPSTPLIPAIFASRGVTLLSGVHVVQPEHAMRVVSEGGGTRQFGKAIRKVTLRLANANPASLVTSKS